MNKTQAVQDQRGEALDLCIARNNGGGTHPHNHAEVGNSACKSSTMVKRERGEKMKRNLSEARSGWRTSVLRLGLRGSMRHVLSTILSYQTVEALSE